MEVGATVTAEKTVGDILAVAGPVLVVVMLILARTRKRKICPTCKEEVRYAGYTSGECDFCRRERAARSVGANTANGQVIEQILLNDAQMRRMYDHDKDRFGQAISVTVYLTAVVLFVTGFAGHVQTPTVGNIVFMAGGLLVAIALKAWWMFAEGHTRPSDSTTVLTAEFPKKG